MKMKGTEITDVETYIAGYPKDTQKLLKQLRAAVKKIVPDVKERISYQMPGYKFHGMLLYFAAYRNHQEYMNREIKFSSVYGFPSWGFPFNWDENFFTIINGAGGILNILIATFCSFVFGFLFKFIWSKISARRIELK